MHFPQFISFLLCLSGSMRRVSGEQDLGAGSGDNEILLEHSMFKEINEMAGEFLMTKDLEKNIADSIGVTADNGSGSDSELVSNDPSVIKETTMDETTVDETTMDETTVEVPNPVKERLSCIQCSSEYEEDCLRGDTSARFLYPCPGLSSSHTQLSPARDYSLCRKIDQTVRGNRTVIRKCGWEGPTDKCYRTASEDFNTRTCSCSTPGCNSAPGSKVPAGAVALVILLTIL